MDSWRACRTLGDRLRWVREEGLGLSSTHKAQAFLEELADGERPSATSFSAVGRYESGKRIPGVDYINALAEAAGVSSGWIVTGEGSPDGPVPGPGYSEGARFVLDKVEETTKNLWEVLGEQRGGASDPAQGVELSAAVSDNGATVADAELSREGGDDDSMSVGDRVRESEERATREFEERARKTVARIRREEARNREQLEAALERSEAELERVRARAAADSPADNILVFPGGWSGVSDSKGPTASRLVDVLQLAAAAGGGSFELDEKVVGRASFPYDWLNSKGLDPARCSVIGVVGDSMEPTLTDGCSILVNRATRRRRVGKLYVLLTGYEGLVVKRAGKDEDGTWLLMSDSEAYPPVPWGDDDTLIGEVKSATRTAWVGV